MRKLLSHTLVLFMLVFSLAATAQSNTITITGRITSFEESLPLEGVTVQAKGGNATTGTMPDGTFSLPVPTSEKTLVVSLPGYEKKEIAVTGKRDYAIVLKRAGNITGDPLSHARVKR